MVFNATFNNVSAISWLSVLLVEETPSTQRKRPALHKSLSSTSRHERNSNSIIIKIKNNKSTTHIYCEFLSRKRHVIFTIKLSKTMP